MLRELSQISNHLEERRLTLMKTILKKEEELDTINGYLYTLKKVKERLGEEEPEQGSLDGAMSFEARDQETGETVRLERVR